MGTSLPLAALLHLPQPHDLHDLPHARLRDVDLGGLGFPRVQLSGHAVLGESARDSGDDVRFHSASSSDPDAVAGLPDPSTDAEYRPVDEGRTDGEEAYHGAFL